MADYEDGKRAGERKATRSRAKPKAPRPKQAGSSPTELPRPWVDAMLASAGNLALFEPRAYRLLAASHTHAAAIPLLRELFQVAARTAKQAVDRDGPARRELTDGIATIVRGAPLEDVAPALIGAQGRLTAAGRAWLATRDSPVHTLQQYADGDAARDGGQLAEARAKGEGASVMAVTAAGSAGQIARVKGCAALVAALRDPIGAKRAIPEIRESAPSGAASQAGPGHGESGAVVNTAAVIAQQLRAALAATGDARGMLLASVDAQITASSEAVRAQLWRDAPLMQELARAMPDRARVMLAAIDPVETLYREVGPDQSRVFQLASAGAAKVAHSASAVTKFPRVRAFLEQHAADAALRARVRDHAKLKAEVIAYFTPDQKRIIARLVEHGTAAAITSEDVIHEAADRGDGATLVRALRELAAADPARFAALEREPLFRAALDKATSPVLVDGISMRPRDVALALWGRAPAAVATGAALVPGLSLSLDEQALLERELFGPALADLARLFLTTNETVVQTMTRAQSVLDRLRVFERDAAGPAYVGILARVGLYAGAELARRLQARHGIELRTWAYVNTGPNIRSGIGRIIGAELGAGVGTFGGTVAGPDAAAPGKVALHVALAQTRCGEVTASELCSVASRNLSRAIRDRAGERAFAIWSQFVAAITPVLPVLRERTGITASAPELMRSAYLEHSGHLGHDLETHLTGPHLALLRGQIGLPATTAADPIATAAKRIWTQLETLAAGSNEARVAAAAAALGEARALGAPLLAYYRAHYGATPSLHAEALVRIGVPQERRASVATALGLDPARVAGAVAPEFADEELVVDVRSVRGSFTAEVARDRAYRLWGALHGAEGIEAVVTELYGDCNDVEQRLIRIAFRALSGGLDLAFYLERALAAGRVTITPGWTQAVANLPQLSVRASSTVGATGTARGLAVSAAAGGPGAITNAGTTSQLEAARAVSVHGELGATDRVRVALGQGENAVFAVLDQLEPAERAAVLDAGDLVARLQALGQWQWERCFKVLTGQADLADRLYSRSHGDGSLERHLGGTDEAGMRSDIAARVRALRHRFDREVRAEVIARSVDVDPVDIDREIARRVLIACGEDAANPAVRDILRRELELGELAELDSLLVNAGASQDWAAAGGSDPDTLLAQIRALSAAERQRRLHDPEYMRRLPGRLQTPARYQAALDALRTASPEVGGASALERLRSAVDAGNRQATLEALAALTAGERAQVARDPLLQSRALTLVGAADQAFALALLSASDSSPDAVDAEATTFANRMLAACRGSWRAVLVQAVACYRLDEAIAPARAAQVPQIRARIWHRIEAAVTDFTVAHDRDPGAKTRDAIDGITMRTVVAAAVLGTGDPSDSLVRENISTKAELVRAHGDLDGADIDSKVDEAGLRATIEKASDEHLASHWTSVVRTPEGGGETLRDRYEDLLAADPASPGPSVDPEAKEVARKRFIEYPLAVSQQFEDLVLPHLGDDRESSMTRTAGSLGRDNKRYNDLAELVRARIPGLSPDVVGAVLRVEPRHAGLLAGTERRETAEYEAERLRRDRHRAGGSSVFSATEEETYDTAYGRYGRAYANAMTDGVVTGAEAGVLAERREDAAQARAAMITAREAAADWASLVVGVVVSTVATVLTGGLAAGPVTMLLLSGMTAGVAAVAKSAVMEQILRNEWDSEDRARLIAQEILSAVVAAGTTYYAQRLLKVASGAIGTAGDKAAKATLGGEPLFVTLAHATLEEATTAAMESVVQAGVAYLDEASWMHGFEEGAALAKEAGLAKLASAGDAAIQAAVTSLVVGVATHGLGKLRGGHRASGHVDSPVDARRRVDLARNLREVFGNPVDTFVEAAVQYALTLPDPVDWSKLPADLLRGVLGELSEAPIEVHTGTAHTHQRAKRVAAAIAARPDLSPAVAAAYRAANANLGAADPDVPLAQWLTARQRIAEAGLKASLAVLPESLSPAQVAAFITWVQSAPTSEELAARAATAPATVTAVIEAGIAESGEAKELDGLGAQIAARVIGVTYVGNGLFEVQGKGDESSRMVAVRRVRGDDVRVVVDGDRTWLEVPIGVGATRLRELVVRGLVQLGAGTHRQRAAEGKARRKRQREHLGREGEQGRHPGVEVHNHFLGSPESRLFADSYGGWMSLLERIVAIDDPKLSHVTGPDGTIQKRGSAGDALRIARDMLAAIKSGTHPRLVAVAGDDKATARIIDELAAEACDACLATTYRTEFNSAYEVRDVLIKDRFGGERGDKPEADHQRGAYRTFAHAVVRRLIADGIFLSEQSISLGKLARQYPDGMLEAAIRSVVAEIKSNDPDRGTALERELSIRWLAMGLTGNYGATATPEGETRTHTPPAVYVTELVAQVGLARAEDAIRAELAQVDRALHQPASQQRSGLEATRARIEAYLSEVLQRRAQAPRTADAAEQARQDAAEGALMRQDVVGLDLAGAEAAAVDAIGKERLRVLVRAVIATARAKNQVLVFRPHIGEGSIDPLKGQGYDAVNARKERADGKPVHYDRARENIEVVLTVLEELEASGELTRDVLTVRFGHATHASPDQAQRMARLGVIAEGNLGSNVITGSLDAAAPGGTPGQRTANPEENFTDHPLLTFIYNDVATLLSTDGHAVERTTMGEEYARAYETIEKFFDGSLRVRVTDAQADGRGIQDADGFWTLGIDDLTNAEFTKFDHAYAQLFRWALDYAEGKGGARRGGEPIDANEPDASTTQRDMPLPEVTPDIDAHTRAEGAQQTDRHGKNAARAAQQASDLVSIGTPMDSERVRKRLIQEIEKHVPEVVLVEAAQAGARTVVVVTASGGGPLGIKALNDILGPEGTDAFIDARNAAIREMFGMTVVAQDYKSVTFASNIDASAVGRDLDAALELVDAKLKSLLVEAMESRGNEKEQSKYVRDRADAALQLLQTSTAAVELQVGVSTLRSAGASDAENARMEASRAARLAAVEGESPAGRVAVYDGDAFAENLARVQQIESELADATITAGGISYRLFEGPGVPSRTALRALRKGDFGADGMSDADVATVARFKELVARVNVLDFYRHSTSAESASGATATRVEAAHRAIKALRSGSDPGDLDVILQSPAPNVRRAQQDTASEAMYTRAVGRHRDRIVARMDIVDLGIDVTRAQAAAAARLAQSGAGAEPSTVDVDDSIVERKRAAAAGVVAVYRAAIGEALASAVARAATGDADAARLVPELNDELKCADDYLLLGGDELTLSMHAAVAPVLGRLAVELASAAGARVAFAATHSEAPHRPSANQRAHHEAANRGDRGHAALKAVEAPLRKLAARVEAMGQSTGAIAARAQLATSWLGGLYAGPRDTVTPGARGADEVVLVDPRRGREVSREEIDAEVKRLTDLIAQLEAASADGGVR